MASAGQLASHPQLELRLRPLAHRIQQEAIAIQANVLALGEGRVVSPRAHESVNARLKAEGLEVLEPDLSEIVKGGGSAHCTTQPLRRVLANG